MTKYCVDKWLANRMYLKTALLNHTDLRRIDYEELMQLCVKHVLNEGEEARDRYDEKTVSIYAGDYSGDVLFVIKKKESFGVEDFLLSYIGYGSCAGCDALEGAIDGSKDSSQLVEALMIICKGLICNIVKPYNYGWKNDERFDRIVWDEV